MIKRITLIAAGLFIFSTGFAQKKAVLNGKVTSGNPVETVYLQYVANDERVTDSAIVSKGAFTLNTSIQEPKLTMLRIKHPAKDEESKATYEMRYLYLQPGKTTITIADSLNNATVKGGKAQQDYEALAALLKPFDDRTKELSAQYMQYRKDKDEEGMKRVEDEFDALDSTRREDVYLTFLNTHKNSPVALYALESYAGYDIDPAAVEPVYNSLNKTLRSSSSGQAFAKRLEAARKTAVGAMAMDFTQNDTLDKPVSLSDFKGKYVLVDFWASWCGPCRAENPNVVKAFNQYKDKNFTVLGVSLDQEGQKQAWMDAIHKDNLTWTQVSDLQFWNNAVAKQYGIRAIPQNFLIDPTGKIIAKNIRGEELQNKLSEILD